MTQDEWNNLSIAEKNYELTNSTEKGRIHLFEYGEVLNYLGDMNLCMELAEEMRQKHNLYLTLENFTHIDKVSWQAVLSNSDKYYLGQINFVNKPEAAICLAYAKAVGIVEE